MLLGISTQNIYCCLKYIGMVWYKGKKTALKVQDKLYNTQSSFLLI